jgi:transposase
MWPSSDASRIFAYNQPTDMRKSFQGLLALVQRVFTEHDPYSGSLFVFVNRRGNYIKILSWDRTGFVLYAKKLERGRFALPGEDDTQEISEKALRFILDGIALGRRRKL